MTRIPIHWRISARNWCDWNIGGQSTSHNIISSSYFTQQTINIVEWLRHKGRYAARRHAISRIWDIEFADSISGESSLRRMTAGEAHAQPDGDQDISCFDWLSVVINLINRRYLRPLAVHGLDAFAWNVEDQELFAGVSGWLHAKRVSGALRPIRILQA
jgi:hypothetical protein